MSDSFQRLLTMSGPGALSLNAQAALGAVRQPERSQFSILVRHFLERFFNHETASPDGDAKARLILIAFAAGLPGFIVALYLWPVYHHVIVFRQDHPIIDVPVPYWLTVNHHFFFILYSFVALGIVTVFEWDMFFPDLLDISVLTTLPIQDRSLFLARVSAIAILLVGFLFDANILALLVLPAVFDPLNLWRLLAGHLLAVAASSLFSAAFILGLQGVLLSVLGERLFRKLSLFIQGLSIAVLLMLLLLFPVFSGVVPALLQSGNMMVRWLPPFWFLGIYQRVLEGPAALPIYATLAHTGCFATLAAVLLAIVTYPLAYLRRVRRLVEGAGTRSTPTRIGGPLGHLLHATIVRPPVRRAVFHFISQTLMRVPRYRIYLVLYGGVGVSVVMASILRFTVVHDQVHMEVSADGMRVAVSIIAFWVIAGLRMAFVSDGNQRGNWVFRIVHGRPPQFGPALEQLLAAKIWALVCSLIITVGACLAARTIAPQEMLRWPSIVAQMLTAVGMCVLLTDVLFLNVTTVPFTGKRAQEKSNLAFTVLKYFAFLPFLSWATLGIDRVIENSTRGFVVVTAGMTTAHLLLWSRHRRIVREHSFQLELEDDEEEFPMKLGLRY